MAAKKEIAGCKNLFWLSRKFDSCWRSGWNLQSGLAISEMAQMLKIPDGKKPWSGKDDL